MEPILGWQTVMPDTRYWVASLYAMVIFVLAISTVRLALPLPERWRRIIGVMALGLVAHGLWWLPHLDFVEMTDRPVGPFLSCLSQAIAVISLDLAYRLEIASPRSSRPRLMSYLAVLSGTLGTSLTIVVGNLAITFPDTLGFNPTVIAMVILAPGLIALIGFHPFGKNWPLNIALGTVAIGLSAGLAQFGSDLASWGGPPYLWHVSSMTAWELAVGTTVILCVGILAYAIWRSQQRFVANLRCAIEALPVGLALYDQKRRLLVWNEALRSLSSNPKPDFRVGMTYTEALKAGLKSSLFPANAAFDPKWLKNKQEQHVPGDWILKSQDGTRWVRLQNREIEDRGLVTLSSDFTEQKKHEAELAAALEQARSANVAKSRFLANMSHEIRTPLNGMVAVTEALSRSALTPTQSEMVALIRSSSETLQILLSDILDLARIESGQMKISNAPFDLVRLVDDTQNLYANAASEKGVQFTCHIAPEARTWVMGDAVRTRQILNNLLSNAVKFTNEGHISLSVSRRSTNLLIRVDDTGIGFEAANLRHLFGRFAQADDQITRRFGGSGLGLSICAELADMMGGSVDGTSQPGLGSSFTVSLPLERITPPNPSPDPAPSAQALANPSSLASKTGLRILLADDNATNRRVVELILDPQNFTLFQVENGQLALDALENQTFDLVLMDMQMPVMDGLTATRMIRERETERALPRTPIIMLTANAMPEHVAASLDAGADAHLAKPFNVSQMLELTYQLTNQKHQPS